MDKINNTINQLSDNWINFEKKYDSYKEHVTNDFNELQNRINNIELTLKRPNIIYQSENKDSHLIKLLRKGEIDNLEFKSFSSEDGGLVIPSLENKIMSNLSIRCPIRANASCFITSSNMVELIIEDGEISSNWVGESKSREDTNTSKLNRKKIPVYELYAQPKVTQRLLDDTSINFEKWLMEQLVNAFLKKENEAFLNGDGMTQPEGILKNETIKSTECNEFKINNLIDLVSQLEEQYLHDSLFLMSRLTLAKVQNFVDGSGRLIWQPSIYKKRVETILGIPVFCCSNMEIKNTDVIVLCNLKRGYQIVDRANISIVRDPYTDKPFVKFYTTKRVGGAVICPDAFKFLKIKK